MTNSITNAISAVAGQSAGIIHTTFPAKVISYNEAAHTCTIQPLFMQEVTNSTEPLTYPQVSNVPIVKWRYKIQQSKNISQPGSSHSHSYTWTDGGGSGVTGGEASHTHQIEFEEIIEEIKLFLVAGDIVVCSCSEKSIDDYAAGTVHNPQSKRKHDITDAIVIGIL